MAPAFMCGMPNPWTPWGRVESPVIYATPQCDHCFCLVKKAHSGKGKHLACCKCGTYMAEKFVRAWFKILGEREGGERTE